MKTFNGEDRVIVRAFVGPDGYIIQTENEGSVLFSEVWGNSPWKAAIMVVSFDRKFYVIDLNSVTVNADADMAATSISEHTDEDAAIMAARLQCANNPAMAGMSLRRLVSIPGHASIPRVRQLAINPRYRVKVVSIHDEPASIPRRIWDAIRRRVTNQ